MGLLHEGGHCGLLVCLGCDYASAWAVATPIPKLFSERYDVERRDSFQCLGHGVGTLVKYDGGVYRSLFGFGMRMCRMLVSSSVFGFTGFVTKDMKLSDGIK